MNIFVVLFFQLGVSSVDELRQILGTDIDENQRKKTKNLEIENEKLKNQKNDVIPADEIVYKDSSTFLKVIFTK